MNVANDKTAAEKDPVGLKVTIGVNFAVAALSFIGGILMAMVAIPNVMKAAHDAGKTAEPAMLAVVGIIAVLGGVLPGAIMLILNKYLRLRKKAARIVEVVLACLMVFNFPLGTLAGAVILYCMVFDKATKEVFTA